MQKKLIKFLSESLWFNFDYNFNRFLVSGGCLIFYVVPKDSAAETEYVNKKRNPMVKPFWQNLVGKKNFGQRIKFAYKEREGQSKLSFNFNSTTKHCFKFVLNSDCRSPRSLGIIVNVLTQANPNNHQFLYCVNFKRGQTSKNTICDYSIDILSRDKQQWKIMSHKFAICMYVVLRYLHLQLICTMHSVVSLSLNILGHLVNI